MASADPARGTSPSPLDALRRVPGEPVADVIALDPHARAAARQARLDPFALHFRDSADARAVVRSLALGTEPLALIEIRDACEDATAWRVDITDIEPLAAAEMFEALAKSIRSKVANGSLPDAP